jgi:hypothetical protein
MATGTDYNPGRTDQEAQQKLTEEVTKAVFKNEEQLTESDNIQRAIKDVIETLYGRGQIIDYNNVTYSDSDGGDFNPGFNDKVTVDRTSQGDIHLPLAPSDPSTSNTWRIVVVNKGDSLVFVRVDNTSIEALNEGEAGIFEWNEDHGWQVISTDKEQSSTYSYSVGSQSGAFMEIERRVVNNKVTITGHVTNNNSQAAKKIVLQDIIPQDYKDYKWFRIKNLWMVMNVKPSGPGSNGFIELDEVSSYQNGVAVTDKTLLHVAGYETGVNRSYFIDAFNQTVGPYNGLLDRVEDINDQQNYIVDSPKDLSLSGFHIAYLTPEQADIDYGGVPISSTTDCDFTFVIEGDLVKQGLL